MIPDIDWKGLALPFAYLLVLGGALMTFSTIHRKRKACTFPYLTKRTQHPLSIRLLSAREANSLENSAKRKP